jgi:hypothetical protein
MPGIAEIALGAAPIAGGALMGLVAGNLKGPDFRGMIKTDLELLEMIPAENTALRADLEASINQRIGDLIVTTEKNRELREAASSYKGNWRDSVLFLCAVLFTIVWWNVPHSRTNWLVMFIVLIALTTVVGLYAGRGILRALRSVGRRAGQQDSAS